MKLKELRKLIREEIKNLNNKDIISFLNQHLDEVKDYLKSNYIDPDEVEDINKIVKDTEGDATLDNEIGVSFKFASDADDTFIGQEGDKFETTNIGGEEIAVIFYNI